MALTMAWIYPGAPACNANMEYADGRHIDVLRVQYYNLDAAGNLIQQTVAGAGCNAYSAPNVADIKNYSNYQYVTLSCASITGFDALATNGTLLNTFNTTLTTFLTANGMTGIDIDCEGFASWTPTQYTHYKTVCTSLGNALHAAGKKLMICGPGIINATYQGFFPNFKYEDFNSLSVDYLTMMDYDFEYDNGAGTPVASLSNITAGCNWMLSKVTDPTKIVMGINSYGYHGTTSGFSIAIDTYNQSQGLPGFSSATRDATSGELTWTNSGISYNYSDTTTLDGKKAAIYATGLVNLSVWHLGGNLWFSSTGGGGASGGGGATVPALTTAGLNLIRDGLAGVASTKITYVALGTGTAAPAVTDTRLQNETFRKAVTSYANGANPGELIITMYLASGDAVGMGIQEFGFYGGSANSAANTGTLLARGLYTHTKLNTESIQFTLDMTA